MPVSTNMEEQVETERRPLSLRGKVYTPRSLPPCDLSKCTRREIKEYFENTYDLDEYIFTAILDDKYFYMCPDRLRLPLLFYLCHTATLYVNKLLLAGLIDKRVNRHFEALFETGVDEMSWDDTENYRMGSAYKWPLVSEVLEYRQKVRELVIDIIENSPLQLPVTRDHPWWSLFMGVEHERIHLETSSVLIRQLPVDYLKRPVNWKYAPASMDEPVGPNEFIRVASSKATLGKPSDFPSYGWDNEYGQIEVDVPEFEATKYPVTNREYVEFVRDGGYQKKELWTEEGWQWVQFRQAKHPIFWVCDEGCKSNCGSDLATYSHCNLKPEGQTNGSAANNGSTLENKFKYRALYDVIDMPWDWPVDVNQHEAKAFCHWKGPDYRLPTEAEYHRMRCDLPCTTDTSCDPSSFNADFPANIGLKYGSSSPVNMYPPNSLGFHDIYGNVWEWSEDHFNGFPGFKTNFLYDDFSSPCFDGRHTMIMGGSWISTGDEASRFCRFAFRRHFFQHMGFRLARSSSPTPLRLCTTEVFVLGVGVSDNPIVAPRVNFQQASYKSCNTQYKYDSKKELDNILEQQFGNVESFGLPLVQLVERAVEKYNGAKSNAITFGCGAGLTTFLLSRTFKEVVGVDYGGRFLDAAVQLQAGKTLEYGPTKKVAKLPENAGIDVTKTIFKQMTWIPNEIEEYDVLVFEGVERLMEPKGWLMKTWECLKSRGLAVFAASKEWDGGKIGQYIGKWFTLVEETTITDKAVTVWQLKL